MVGSEQMHAPRHPRRHFQPRLALFWGCPVHRPQWMRSNTNWSILCLIKYLRDGHYFQVSSRHYAR